MDFPLLVLVPLNAWEGFPKWSHISTFGCICCRTALHGTVASICLTFHPLKGICHRFCAIIENSCMSIGTKVSIWTQIFIPLAWMPGHMIITSSCFVCLISCSLFFFFFQEVFFFFFNLRQGYQAGLELPVLLPSISLGRNYWCPAFGCLVWLKPGKLFADCLCHFVPLPAAYGMSNSISSSPCQYLVLALFFILYLLWLFWYVCRRFNCISPKVNEVKGL